MVNGNVFLNCNPSRISQLYFSTDLTGRQPKVDAIAQCDRTRQFSALLSSDIHNHPPSDRDYDLEWLELANLMKYS